MQRKQRAASKLEVLGKEEKRKLIKQKKQNDIRNLIEMADAYTDRSDPAYELLNGINKPHIENDDETEDDVDEEKRVEPKFPSDILNGLTIFLFCAKEPLCKYEPSFINASLYELLINMCEGDGINRSGDLQFRANFIHAAILCIKGAFITEINVDRLFWMETLRSNSEHTYHGLLNGIQHADKMPEEADRLRVLAEEYVKGSPSKGCVQKINDEFNQTIDNLQTQVLAFVNSKLTGTLYFTFNAWAGEVLLQTKQRLENRTEKDFDEGWLDTLRSFKFASTKPSLSSTAMLQALGGPGEVRVEVSSGLSASVSSSPAVVQPPPAVSTSAAPIKMPGMAR